MKLIRKFVDEKLVIESWSSIEKYYEDLETREIADADSLLHWWKDRSELDSVLEEEQAWRYIKMNCNTEDQELADAFNTFVTEINPHIAAKSNLLNKKLIDSVALSELNGEKYFVCLRSIKKEIELFREKNIPLFAELEKESQEFGVISSKMTVDYDGKKLTMQQAANYLKNIDRSVREEVYKLSVDRRLIDVDALHELFTRLAGKRTEVAKNADFQNFRDYKFEELGRFDYSLKDCIEFHNAIAAQVKPIVEKIHSYRQHKLRVETLKPWDLSVDTDLKPPLKPFETTDELTEKAIQCFSLVRPKYGEFLSTMRDKGYLDLGSKLGKAPGGFLYPLYESNVPFIFMNATRNQRDMVTMMHEGGHAIHSFLCAGLELVDFKSTPSEVAELASMTMELISMEYWHVFYKDEEELKRAKRSQLEDIMKILPWVATVDKFQHWLYTNQNHSLEDRTQKWVEIFNEFGSEVVDWSGYEKARETSWQNQLHIFEVPFYYIEYAISQLGAIAIWRNFKNNQQEALDAYERALKLGYTKTIPEIYEAAGIRFDFSIEYMKELMDFVGKELDKLN